MTKLAAEQFHADPRLDQARKLIAQALADAKNNLVGPRPADPARAQDYQQRLDDFAKLRGGALPIPTSARAWATARWSS